jgi:hypothetical protein
MTHKYRGCIIVLSINKSIEPNEEQKVLTSGFDQGFTVNTSERIVRAPRGGVNRCYSNSNFFQFRLDTKGKFSRYATRVNLPI